MEESLVKSHTTTQSKFICLDTEIMRLYFSGNIDSIIYADLEIETERILITKTPELAFYKDGKALNAL